MTGTEVPPVLVTGATGRVGRVVVDQLVEAVIIRPGMFASNVVAWWAAAIRAAGVARWPYGAAETAPVDDRDVAAVAARTLYQWVTDHATVFTGAQAADGA